MTQTIEEALADIIAEHGVRRIDVGMATYRSDGPYGVILWWDAPELKEWDGSYCSSGEGATLDDALAAAIERMTEKRGGTRIADCSVSTIGPGLQVTA